MKRMLCLVAILSLVFGCAIAETCSHTGEVYCVPSTRASYHDVYCANCDMILRTEKCTMSEEYVPTEDGKGHFTYCTACDRKSAIKEHSFVSQNDGTYLCKLCGITTDKCPHQQTYETVENGKTVVCCRGCGTRL